MWQEERTPCHTKPVYTELLVAKSRSVLAYKNGVPDFSVNSQPSTLLCGKDLVFTLQFFHPGLGHEVCDVLLQVIDATTHVINSSNDLVRHCLKFILHLLQECLHLRNNKTKHTPHAHPETPSRDGDRGPAQAWGKVPGSTPSRLLGEPHGLQQGIPSAGLCSHLSNRTDGCEAPSRGAQWDSKSRGGSR